MLKALFPFLFAICSFSVYAQVSDQEALSLLSEIDQADYVPYPTSRGLDAFVLKTVDGQLVKFKAGFEERVTFHTTQVIQVKAGTQSYSGYFGCNVDRTCGWDPTDVSTQARLSFSAVPATQTEWIAARINQASNVHSEVSEQTLQAIKRSRNRSAQDVLTSRASIDGAIKEQAHRVLALKTLQTWKGGNFVDYQTLKDSIADIELAKKLITIW